MFDSYSMRQQKRSYYVFAPRHNQTSVTHQTPLVVVVVVVVVVLVVVVAVQESIRPQ